MDHLQFLMLLSQPVEQDEVNRNSVLSTISILIGILLGLAALGALIHRWVKGWIEDLMQESRETRKSLKTKNGKTVGEYTEESADRLGQVNGRLDQMCEKLDRTNKISLSALTLTENNGKRIDRHLEGHAPKEK